MLLLAIDTSSKNGSLALARVESGRDAVEIIDAVPLAGGTFSAQLVPQIANLLGKHGCSKSDLGAFAAASGPGSFTGLRVGLAAIKALAEVLKKPIATVSMLEAIASAARIRDDGRVLSILDAGRGEVYAGDYEIGWHESQSRLHMRSERLLRREELIAEAKIAAQETTIATPDHSLAEALNAAEIQHEIVDPPGSPGIARLGWEHIQRGETVRPEKLEANYIRRSDAEIFSGSK